MFITNPFNLPSRPHLGLTSQLSEVPAATTDQTKLLRTRYCLNIKGKNQLKLKQTKET